MKNMPLKLQYELLDVFEEKELAFGWLFSELIVLNNKTPIEVIAKGDVKQIITILGRIKHGIVS